MYDEKLIFWHNAFNGLTGDKLINAEIEKIIADCGNIMYIGGIDSLVETPDVFVANFKVVDFRSRKKVAASLYHKITKTIELLKDRQDMQNVKAALIEMQKTLTPIMDSI